MTKLLVLCDDFWHPGEVVEAGLKPFEAKYDITYIRDAKDMLTPEMLREYHAVLCCKSNQINGSNKAPWFEEGVTETMPEDFMDYVKEGGAFLSLHAGNNAKEGDKMAELIGNVFAGHPPRCSITVKPSPHSITEGIKEFTVRDEHYAIKMVCEDADIFCKSYSEAGGEQVCGYTRTLGRGRLCVLTLGHILSVWQNEEFQKLLDQAICWCILKDR